MIKDMMQMYIGGIFTGETMKVASTIPTFGGAASSLVGAGFLGSVSSKVTKWIK